MHRISFIFSSLLSIFLIFGCVEKSQQYLELGKESYNNKNYPLAKNQFLMVKENDSGYDIAQKFIIQIDSIENAMILNSKISNSVAKIKTEKLKQEYSGNYKVEVLGVSSKKEVEIYVLEADGKAQWLWVYYVEGKKGKVDDRKKGNWYVKEGEIKIDIQGQSGLISETFVDTDGILINKSINKRSLKRTNETY